ncbi:hypothetical protein Stsp01_66530 [Streptomyces sp. NBRC 13847]|uniref:hypothetical protein n=1 Tax=Streptomyces TaxID=1883 RepID=UPI0024A1A86F|nr:hypothetical protein [Streptomyces sp. NBRC 13847]GLW19910.1 hypothetical protein Stsp01_66530 [Streptomyces sp. NBRC 13847]
MDAFDAAEVLRAVRAVTAQAKQRRELFREWERHIEEARVERLCPPKATSSAGRLRIVPPLGTPESYGAA